MALPLLVFEGDSITALNGALTDLGLNPLIEGWAYHLVESITSPAPAALQSSNLAVSGSTTVTMAARSSGVDALFDATRPWQILFVWIGRNDLALSGTSATTVYNNIVSYCQARRTVGFKVIIFTLTPDNSGGADPSFEADRLTISANIRANWATFADGVADVAADPTIGPLSACSDPTLYYSPPHLSAKGHWYSASIARDQLQILVPSIQMALSANTVWEVRASGASDNNGGGFVVGSGGTDYSQQNAAQLTLSDLATTGIVTTVTSVTGGFTAAMVGNILNIASGTNFTAGLYQILTVPSSTSITLDRAPCTAAASAGTGSVGGALATLGKLATVMTIGSNKAFATGAFTSAATLTFAPGSVTPAGTTPPTFLIGYGVTRGDGIHATLTLQTNTGLTGILCAASGFWVQNFDVDCASLGTSTGISLTGAFSAIRNCKASNFTAKGLRIGANAQSVLVDSEATGGTAAATAALEATGNPSTIARCYVHDNACPGINANTSGVTLLENLVVNNSGAASDGVLITSGCVCLNNTIHNNGRDGIRNSNTGGSQQMRNNLLTANGAFGLNYTGGTAAPASPDTDGNAYWNNTSGARNNTDSVVGIYGVSPYVNVRDVILTASPYVGPTTDGTANFALNNTAGAGKACRAAGSPGAFPGLTTTTGFADMGAVQHKDSGAPGVIMAIG